MYPAYLFLTLTPTKKGDLMHADNEEFWKRTAQRADLDGVRRKTQQLHVRGWRRNVIGVVIFMLALGVIWVIRR